MHSLAFAAGETVQFTAIARAGRGHHRWDIRVLAADGAVPRAVFGSHIGGLDMRQRVEIPAQDVDCRLEVESRHETANGWVADRPWFRSDTLDRLLIGYCNPAAPGARPDDFLLSFIVGRPERPEEEKPMAKGQKKSNREVRKPKQAKAKTHPAARSFVEVAAGNASKPGASPGRKG